MYTCAAGHWVTVIDKGLCEGVHAKEKEVERSH